MQRVTSFAFLTLLVCAPAAAQTPCGPSGQGDDARAPIVASRIRNDVRLLSSDDFSGRGPGQVGETKTLPYLIAQLKAAGVEPFEPGGTWLQDVPLRAYRRLPGATLGLKMSGAPFLTLVPGRDVTASSHQPGETRITDAPIVFVGYGVVAPSLGWNSFKGADLHGKTALILANDPDFEATPESPAFGKFGGKAMVISGRFGSKVAAAQEAGAAAVLVIHEDAAASYPWRQVANGDRIESMEIAAAGQTPPPSIVSGWLQKDIAARLLKSAGLDLDRLKVAARDPNFVPVALNGASLSADFVITTRDLVSHNVVGRILGCARPDEMVVYGAHWDANGKGAPDANGDDIRNGAVDNATGTAELLETARAFGAGPRPARSIVFVAFTSEEKGLLGSDYYAAHPPAPLAKIAAVINLDPHVMLGRARNMELVGGGRTDLEGLLSSAAAAEGLTLGPEPHPEAGWYFRSDHYSFAKRGVPALSFRIGRDLVDGGLALGTARADDYNVNRYHQPGDEFDPAWTFLGAAQEAAVAWRVGSAIARSKTWPAWTPGADFEALRDQTAGERR